MILALFTSSVAGLAAPADPAPLPGAQDAGPGLTLVVQETQLSLESRSLEPLLLLVAGQEQAPLVATWLPFGAALEASFTRGALEDLRFEVVQRSAGHWRSTGALSFPSVDAAGSAQAWVFPSGVALSADLDGLITPLLAAPSLLPRDSHLRDQTPAEGRGAIEPLMTAPLHVPVPVPSDRPTPGTPPKLEKRPLPPV